MQYLEVDEAINFEDVMFTECRAVKVYFIYRDRNAWHETRSTQYKDGCMHASFESAAQAAENMREAGSVFYIEEIPALQFFYNKLSLVITQINTGQPLQYIQCLSDEDNFFLIDIYEHFKPVEKNSIIRLIWHKSKSRNLFEGMSDTGILKKYRSIPKRSNRLLDWEEINYKMSPSAVIRLAIDFDNFIVSENRKVFVAHYPELSNKFSISMDEIELSVRSANSLKNSGIRFIGDLVKFTEFTLNRELNSSKCLKEIKDILAEMDLVLTEVPKHIFNMPIEELELSVRTFNCLKLAEINTVAQIIELSETDLLRKQNIGRKSVNELNNTLIDMGLTLAPG